MPGYGMVGVMGLLLVAGLVAWNLWPPTLGLVQGRLRPCPGPPHCVCSDDPDPGHRVEAWPLGDPATAEARLRAAVLAEPGARIVVAEGEYFRVLFRTRWLRFRDDGEFVLDGRAGVVRVRSSSRVGYEDWGMNRMRLGRMRGVYESGAGEGR